jgi:predicted small metal-binding protein
MSASPTSQQRKFIDCREYPSEKNCSVKISGTEDEVVELAVLHATSYHGHENSSELRDEIRKLIKNE